MPQLQESCTNKKQMLGAVSKSDLKSALDQVERRIEEVSNLMNLVMSQWNRLRSLPEPPPGSPIRQQAATLRSRLEALRDEISPVASRLLASRDDITDQIEQADAQASYSPSTPTQFTFF